MTLNLTPPPLNLNLTRKKRVTQYMKNTLNTWNSPQWLKFAYWRGIVTKQWITSVLIAQECFKRQWQSQDVESMLICSSEHFSAAVLLGRVVYIKGGPDGHTMETKQNKTDLRDPLVWRWRFYFSSTNSESQVGVSAATELPCKQTEGTVPHAPRPVA